MTRKGEIESITRYDTFSYALKFGILLMVEVFIGKEEIVGEDDAGNFPIEPKLEK